MPNLPHLNLLSHRWWAVPVQRWHLRRLPSSWGPSGAVPIPLRASNFCSYCVITLSDTNPPVLQIVDGVFPCRGWAHCPGRLCSGVPRERSDVERPCAARQAVDP